MLKVDSVKFNVRYCTSFKWLKQHVKLKYLFSHSPIGIWNQMFIALITVALAEIMRLTHQPKKTLWTFLCTVQEFLFDSIRRLLQDFSRSPRKRKGRQKIPIPNVKTLQYGEGFAIVSPITRDHFIEKEKKNKSLRKMKKQHQIK